MSTINDLSVVSTVDSADKFPIWSNANGVTRGLPVSVLDGRYVTQSQIALLAVSSAEEIFVAGVDFTPGVSLALTLKNQYYSGANIEVFFDASFQGSDQYALNGVGLVFTSAIPVGVQKVYVRGGSARVVISPGDGTVQDSSVANGSTLAFYVDNEATIIQNRVVDSVAALAALDPTVYNRVFVTGYGSVNDGYGGDYFYSASTPQSQANGASVVASSSGVGCWVGLSIDLPQVAKQVSLIQQGGAVANTNFFTPVIAGLFRVNYFLTITNAGTGGTFTPNITTSDGVTGRVLSGAAAPATAGGLSQGSFYVYSIVTPMLYSVTASAITGTPVYSLYLTVERLS